MNLAPIQKHQFSSQVINEKAFKKILKQTRKSNIIITILKEYKMDIFRLYNASDILKSFKKKKIFCFKISTGFKVGPKILLSIIST